MGRHFSPLGYEIAAGRGEIELGPVVGLIETVDGREPTRKFQPGVDYRESVAIPALRGYACRFGKPHIYKGRFEVFMPGCFARNIAGVEPVRFLLRHDGAQELGSTADGLELLQDDHGLAFSLKLPETKLGREAECLVREQGWTGMSVGYKTMRSETKEIDGETVHLITDVHLEEISLCRRGAVKEAHTRLIDAAKARPLREELKFGHLVVDGAATAFERALKMLKDGLGGLKP